MKLKLILSFFVVLFLIGCSTNEYEMTTTNQAVQSNFEMQGYELNVPKEYECSGGYFDGNRNLDVICNSNSENYKIIVDYNLPARSINRELSFTENLIPLREIQYETDCIEYKKDVVHGSDTYLCIHSKNNQKTITIGFGKIFGESFARWVEAHLIILNENLDENELTQRLENFLRESIQIDWDSYYQEQSDEDFFMFEEYLFILYEFLDEEEIIKIYELFYEQEITSEEEFFDLLENYLDDEELSMVEEYILGFN